MKIITVKFEDAFVSLDHEMQDLIEKYDLNFRRRKNYEEGSIDSKAWTIPADKVMELGGDFAKNGFTVSIVDADEIGIELK